MQTEALSNNAPGVIKNSPASPSSPAPERRGFSSLEKWIIWAVFCLLIGLSSRFIFFPALLLISWGVARFQWYRHEQIVWWRRWPAGVVFLAGVGMMLWPLLES